MTPERWQQIARLFDEVLELEPPRRASVLAEACVGDPSLRHEVEQMLAAHERAGDFLLRDAADIEAAQLAAEQISFQPGHKIAHFEILAPLGAGAMGEVYRARDPRLERQVALKLLPARFTQDAGRLWRFEREARAASALNHPNIVTVYEVGADGTNHYIVVEFVEGVTLRERLANGPLPLPEAISSAIQIAEALGAAHAAGIVHRDIKPENVMVRADGVIKVLDFGIAKLVQKPVTAERATPLRNHSTEQGTVIGTPGYMSPEQARGLDVDARTDIFSLGVVLYEMLAGHAPFLGTTQADVIVALLEKEPAPLAASVPALTVGLAEIVAKALTKDAAQRYQTVEAMLADLQAVEAGQGALFATPLVQGRAQSGLRRNWRLILTAVALLSLLLISALAWGYYQRGKNVNDWGELSKLQSTTPYSKRLGLGGHIARPALSPDGKHAAFNVAEDGQSYIIVKDLIKGTEAKLINRPFRYDNPVWSPDGTKLAVIGTDGARRAVFGLSYPAPAESKPFVLKEISQDTAISYLVAWRRSAQGERIYYESWYNFFALDPATGQIEQLTQFDPQRAMVRSFQIAPNSSQFVYLEVQKNTYNVMLKSLQGEPLTLWRSADPISSLSWFPDGERLAFVSSRGGSAQIFMLHLATRTVEQLTSGSQTYDDVVVGPDGNSILTTSSQENANIFAWDLDTGTEAEHTSEIGLQLRPEPSPNGRQLLFQATSNLMGGNPGIFIKPIASDGQALQLTTAAINARWSPDGESVAYIHTVPNLFELWIANTNNGVTQRLVEGPTPARYLPTPYLANFVDYAWSPDSARIAYSSRKSGKSNLWIVTRDGANDTNVTGNNERNLTIHSPTWSPDNERLAYLSSTNADNQPGPIFGVWLNTAGKNELLLQRDVPLQLIGWNISGRELWLAASTGKNWSVPQEVELFSLDLARRTPTPLLKVAAAYLPTFRLAPDGSRFVAVARQQGRDNLELISVNGRTRKQLTNNSDPTVFYTSPAWAADGRHLFYSKQSSWQVLHLLKK